MKPFLKSLPAPVSGQQLAPLIGVAILTAYAMSLPGALSIWSSGVYLDTDHAMRMVELRDWLAGQDWHDLRALRLNPPHDVWMHWSRLVDLPLAALFKAFALVLDVESAERAMRIAYPLLMQALLLTGLALCGAVIGGLFGAGAALLLGLGSGFVYGQFSPGNIDHHAPQIVCLVFMTWGLLAACDPQRARHASLAGICAALSLTIAMENLPFILIACAIFPCAYLLRGQEMRAPMMNFALSFSAALVASFGLFQAPERWGALSCDALSLVHVEAACSSAMAIIGLHLWERHLTCPPKRLQRVIAVLIAGVIAAVPLLIHRSCLVDPFNGLDPVVRMHWLNNVTEARPLLTYLATESGAWGFAVMPWALGMIALVIGISREEGILRARLLIAFALCLAGCASILYMIRSLNNLMPLAMIGGVWAASAMRRALRDQSELTQICAGISATLPFMALMWILVGPEAQANPDASYRQAGAQCRHESLRSLNDLPRGLILAPIDVGAHLLALTHHSVVAAPYHRNNQGNRLMYDLFLSSAPRREALAAAGIRYIFFCHKDIATKRLMEAAPEGLAARLVRGEKPSWLKTLISDDMRLLFEVANSPP